MSAIDRLFVNSILQKKIKPPKDADGDGMVDDGTPRERPAGQTQEKPKRKPSEVDKKPKPEKPQEAQEESKKNPEADQKPKPQENQAEVPEENQKESTPPNSLSAVNVFENGLPPDIVTTGGNKSDKVTKSDIGRYYERLAGEQGLTGEMNEKTQKFLVDTLTEEVEYAIDKYPNPQDNGIGWYTERYDNAIEIASEVYPSLKKDYNRSIFTVMVATASNGESVEKNFEMAMDMYGEHLEKYGEDMPMLDSKLFKGQREDVVEATYKQVNKMIERHGKENFHKEMMKPVRVGDMKKQGINISEGVNVEVTKAFILGPKIGAFYTNLNAKRDDPKGEDISNRLITMDRWFFRSMRRILGNPMSDKSQKTVAGQLDRLRKVAESAPEDQMWGYNRETVLSEIDRVIAMNQGGKKDPAASGTFGDLTMTSELGKWAKETVRHYETLSRKNGGWKKLKEKAGWNGSKPSEDPDSIYNKQKWEARGAAKTFWNNFSQMNDAGANTSERAFWRETVARIKQNLAKKGKDLTGPDIQAIIWYSEKRLHEKFGIKGRAILTDDYESAARRIKAKRTKAGTW